MKLAILAGMAASGLVYLTFAFGAAGLDITLWSDDARVFCALIMAVTGPAVLALVAIEDAY